jgi:hypothetical protein
MAADTEVYFEMRKLVRLSARRVAARLVTVTLLGVLASTGVAAARACQPPAPVSPFAQWGDTSGYFLVPGGSFDSGTSGWALNRAALGAGGSGFDFGSVSASRSLTISAGGSAISPSLCLNNTMPSLRFFARELAPGSDLRVQVTSTGGFLIPVTITVTDLRDGSMPTWAPTGRVALLSVQLPPGGSLPAVLKFQVPGATGAWQIADIYVDPYRVD